VAENEKPDTTPEPVASDETAEATAAKEALATAQKAYEAAVAAADKA